MRACQSEAGTHSHVMGPSTDVCSPVANNPVPFADNLVEPPRIVAVIVVRNQPMFAVQTADNCSSQHIGQIASAFGIIRSSYRRSSDVFERASTALAI